jgi:4-diphosphocytidyl-2-C-methyl-D-erythritol kinase
MVPAGKRQAVWVSAPAKINLVLRVLERRADGYHNLWSIMHTVGLEDELQLCVRTGDGVTLQSDSPEVPTDGRNLIVRAAQAVLVRSKRTEGIAIRLVKRIPVSAGLGGGSSDAAATILGLNLLLDLGWSVSDMIEVGSEIGSDVPFFFSAPCALVRGRGERVTPLSVAGTRWVVLVNPGFPIATAWAYGRLASTRRAVPSLAIPPADLDRRTSASWDDIVPLMANDFEAPLDEAHPVLADIRQALRIQGAQAALVSGSGATVFGIFGDETSAVRAKAALTGPAGWRVFAVPACAKAPAPCVLSRPPSQD